MHPESAAIVAAVRACIGTRFRPQGRRPCIALDCVGVALVGAEAAGCRLEVEPYALGGDHERRLDDTVASLGCRRVEVVAWGDLMVFAPTAQRRHLAVAVPGGIVHAHAGLGRVVEGPLDPAWTLIAAWRFPEKD